MFRKLLNRALMVIVALVVVGLIVYAFLPQPAEVDVASVERGHLAVTVDEDGRTRIRERFVISAPLAGTLRRVTLDPGDAVAVGDLLLTIEPTDPELLDPRQIATAEARVRASEASLQRARAAIGQAQAQLDLARSERDRIERAFRANAATRREYDVALLVHELRERDLEAAEFAAEVAQFELELARAAFVRTSPNSDPERLHIQSPVAGRVLRVHQESETVVMPGHTILEVGDPQQLELEIDVLSTDAVRIRPGSRAYIDHWGGEETLEAVVRLVEPQAFTHISALGVEEQRVNIILDFVSPTDAWRTLGDGYRVEASIVTWEDQDVLKIPTSALFRHDAGWAVFRVLDNRAHLQPITIGRSTGLETQVLQGLDEGDTVITHPSDRITDDTAIIRRANR